MTFTGILKLTLLEALSHVLHARISRPGVCTLTQWQRKD